jgi:HPt (histidine-containing phosphotransfer) domain-containing protein
MRRAFLCGGLWLLVALPVRAEAPPPKVVVEAWDAVYLDGAKAGHQHTVVQQIERDGQKLFRTTKTQTLVLKRYNAIVTHRMAASCEETADGKVVGESITQFLDRGEITQSGRVEGNQLIVRTPSDPDGRAVPWNEKVLGLYRQDRFFQDRKVKPGDRFHFLDYQLPFLSVVTMDVAVKDREETSILTIKKERETAKAEWVKKALRRVEITPGKVRVGENSIPLPRLVWWLDEEGRPLRQETEMPGLGRMTMYRTTKAVAADEGVAPALLPDLGLNTLVKLDRAIEHPHDAREIVYRVTVSGDDDPSSIFARDGRQRVEQIQGNTFELRVRPVREPQEVENPGKVKEEFVKSSYFLDSDNEDVQALAKKLVGDETDPWRVAGRLEKWVHENMKGSASVGFVKASQVCRALTGDCRQHAMLLAALCRAAGIPSRTAIGLVYVPDPDRGPVLCFHMWTEVWVRGQWLMLDAVLGRGSVGAAHLKVTDHSWHDTQTLAPVLPVTRVLGKIKVEVVSVK